MLSIGGDLLVFVVGYRLNKCMLEPVYSLNLCMLEPAYALNLCMAYFL